ncbi:MAG: DNA polymerase IV [Sulfuricurvum sp.]|jgi:DNA polymerase-4
MKIHIDLDCFFVSAQRTIDPSLIGKAVGVGGRGDQYIFSHEKSNQELLLNNSGSFVGSFFHRYAGDDLNQFIDADGRVRGILTTASYEARAYGINTGMTIREALIRCPSLIIKGPDMQLYHRLSHALHQFLQERIPLIEQASIDEFYGDLKGWVTDDEIPAFIDHLRHEIKRKLNLPVSIGAANSKHIAKLATESAKPFGCKTIMDNEVASFVSEIAVQKFPGIGSSMQRRCAQYHLKTLGDLLRAKRLVDSWGPYAQSLYQRVSGHDLGELVVNSPRKSIGISRTFDPIDNRDEIRRRISILSRHLAYAISKLEVNPTTFILSLYYLHHPKSHSALSESRLFNEQRFRQLCRELLAKADLHASGAITHLGISASAFSVHSRRVLSLIDYEEDARAHSFDQKSRLIRDKYGCDALKWGNEL